MIKRKIELLVRIITLVVLLAISPYAVANHHRGHAIDRLAGMDEQFETINYHLDQIESKCSLKATAQLEVDIVRGYSDKMISWLPSFRAQVLTSDLDVVRRKFSQPDSSGPQSVASLLSAALHHAKELIGHCKKANFEIDGIIARISWAWALTDQVVWHVDDAIREEVYGDPLFICAGPNHHC